MFDEINETKFLKQFKGIPENYKNFKIENEEKNQEYQDIDFKEEYVFDLHYDFWENYNKK